MEIARQEAFADGLERYYLEKFALVWFYFCADWDGIEIVVKCSEVVEAPACARMRLKPIFGDLFRNKDKSTTFSGQKNEKLEIGHVQIAVTNSAEVLSPYQ